MTPSVAEIRDLFRTKGLRLTRQRETLYQALAESKSHPTAEELLQIVRRLDPGLSLATVYNTLEAFSASGLCRRLACARGIGACRYDADLHDHVHLVTSDGRVMDLPIDLGEKVLSRLGPDVLDEIEARTGIRLGAASVQFVAP
jgi:Fur family peroxide stress response transcriptional regulator